MSKGIIVDENDLPVGDVRICYVRAWDDPQWCEQNGLPSPKERRSGQVQRGIATRRANEARFKERWNR
jgi:hypothetical protein